MLRLLAIVLLLANALSGAYALGWLAPLGLLAQSQHEPERLIQQVAPERLTLAPVAAPAVASEVQSPSASSEVPAEALAPAMPAAPPAVLAGAGNATSSAAVPSQVAPKALPTACWQASGYNPAQTIVLNAALQDMPTLNKRWNLSETVLPARWIVYLGKFPSTEVLQKRKADLKEAKVEFREVKVPNLMPGLALGTYSTEEAANTALRDAKKAGVRDAKVAQERAEVRSVTLKLKAITVPERDQIRAMPALAGKTLQPCD